MERCIHLYCNGREGCNWRSGYRVWPFFWNFRRCPGKLRRSRHTSRVGGVVVAFSVSWLSLLPGTRQLLPVRPTNREPSSGEGGSRGWVNVKPCISSRMDGAKGPCFSFCMPLVPSYLLGFLSACGSDSLRYSVIYSLNIFNYHYPSSLAIIF